MLPNPRRGAIFNVDVMKIPTAYADGHAKGRHLDPDRAANHVAHTAIGDPLADEPLYPESRARGIL